MKWRSATNFSPLPLKNFDDSNSGIQAPFKLPADAKEVDYFLIMNCYVISVKLCTPAFS